MLPLLAVGSKLDVFTHSVRRYRFQKKKKKKKTPAILVGCCKTHDAIAEERLEVVGAVDAKAKVLELEREYGLDVPRVGREYHVLEERRPHDRGADGSSLPPLHVFE